MVIPKTTKALSLILPIALLISTNMNAMSEEASSTAYRVFNVVKNVAAIVLGASAARFVQAGLSTHANTPNGKTETVKVLNVQLSADKKSLNDMTGKVLVTSDKEITTDLNTLTKANFAKELKGFAKEDLSKVDVSTVDEKDVQKTLNNGYKDAFKAKFTTNLNPFKKDAPANSTTNLVNTWAPSLTAAYLLVYGIHGLASDAGLCCKASEDSAE